MSTAARNRHSDRDEHSRHGPGRRVSLPPGETALGDIGIYTVATNPVTGPVTMPPSWTGHFEEQSGSRTCSLGQPGRVCILLHSPWRVPARACVGRLPLHLPDVRPITLSFGIAMGPDVAVPGKSDGVTFGAYLLEGTSVRELLHIHHDKATWQDNSFDLSAYAGKQVTVRLQTEPGPARDPSWDYSFFGDARITAGAAETGIRERLERITSTGAYRATAGPTCGFANDAGRGVTPATCWSSATHSSPSVTAGTSSSTRVRTAG